MTPIEWNDSEPGFPDFLPPLPKNAQDLTPEQAKERLEGLLEAAGVSAAIFGYAFIEFPDGKVLQPANVFIDAKGYNRR